MAQQRWTDTKQTFEEQYEERYGAMRRGGVVVEGPLLEALRRVCQQNLWLKVGGPDFEPDGFCVETDYPLVLTRYDDMVFLERFFEHGNWGIRTAVQYLDLIFVQQVNGGDEWLTIKIDDDHLTAFESISFAPSVTTKRFADLIERLHRATLAECRELTY